MLPKGFLIIGPSGRILAANRAARNGLDQGEPIAECDGFVVLTSESHNNRLRKLIQCTELGDRSVSALRVPRRTGKPLSILFIPIREEETETQEEDPLALLILDGAPEKPDPTLLMDFFGFTPAESKVASLLMQGKTVDDVAETLGTTENTTRNHLKHMYSKTMTRRQGELVHTLLSSPAALTVPESPKEEKATKHLHRAREISSL